MSYVGTGPELVRQGILPISTTNVSSISTNFYSNIVVLGYQNEDVNRGCIEVHRYNSDNDTWFDKIKIDGPHENSYFGKSVDMDWDGERIVVGANTAANVYIYDWDGGQFQNYSNIIEGPVGLGSEFGFSVSIAKNNPDVISIGSPGDNMMYVYQLENDTWAQRFSNSGVDINNLIPYSNPGQPVYDSSTNVVTNSEYNRYGEVVRLSSGGDYVIVGQPGTPLLTINTYNTTNFSIIDPQYYDEETILAEPTPGYFDDDMYIPPTEGVSYPSVYVHTISYYTQYENYNRQLGSVRVFKSDDASWGLSNTQVGNLLYGERNFTITDDEKIYNEIEPDFYAIDWYQVGWGFPGFGLSCDITSDGKYIVVGAPLYGGNQSETGHTGKVYTYELQDNIWVEINTVSHEIPLRYTNSGELYMPRYGLNVRLDYSGNRLVVNGSSERNDTLGIYDFTETSWSPIRSVIFYKKNISERSTPDTVIETINGKIIIMSRTEGGQNTILFTNNELTQFIYGNSLNTGYISAHDVYSRNKLGIGVPPDDESPYYLIVKTPAGVKENIVEITSTTGNFSERSVSGINFSGNLAYNEGYGFQWNDPLTSCRLVSGFSGSNAVYNAYFSIRVPEDAGFYENPPITLKDCITCANGGNVGILNNNPAYTLDVNGTLSANNVSPSDDRIKYNEQDVPNCLDVINKLKPQRYEKIMMFPQNRKGQWIPTDEEWENVKGDYEHGEEYGFIAQDVREIPELSFLVSGEETSNVTETQTPLALNYNGIFVVAVGAIQELDKKNKALEAQLASVLARLDALEATS